VSYPIEFDADVMLERIGVEAGWRDARELDAALAACRRHLANPDTVFNYVTIAQVWGRRPL
jgi:hypothetical protein